MPHRHVRALLVAVSLTLAAVFAAGCLLVRSKRDLARFDQASRIGGHVACDTLSGKPVCVTLYEKTAGTNAFQLVAYQVFYESGEFVFYRPAGTYYLFAFEDLNEDFTFQPDTERVGWYGAPSPIEATPGLTLNGLRIKLYPPDKARQILPQLYALRSSIHRLQLESKHVGVVADLADQRFAPENGTLGMWEPVKFLDEYGSGFFFLEPYSETKIPVLFVHGVGGTPRSFAPLIEGLDRTRFQPWVAHYPSGLRLTILADGLANLLAEVQTRYKCRHIVVVAHSMGGLVARGALNRLAADGQCDVVPLFITIATPWQGHPGAETGVDRSPVILPCWYDMSPGSPFLVSLSKTPLPPQTAYHLLFGYHGGRPLFTDDNSDGTIPLSSLLDENMQNAAAKIYGFPATHASVLRSPAVSSRVNRILADYADAARSHHPQQK